MKSFTAGFTAVHVHDAGGSDRDSETIQVIINGDFGAPATVTLAPGLQRVTLTWMAAASKGYRVEYSDNLLTWKTPGNGVFQPTFAGAVHQWIDQGPPGTESPPSGAARRFYRITPF